MKRKFSAILLALTAMIGIPIITAPAANAVAWENACTGYVWDVVKGNGRIATSAEVTCNTTQSVSVRIHQKWADGTWHYVPNSAHIPVSAGPGQTIRQSSEAVWCPNNTKHTYRGGVQHTYGGGTPHNHEGWEYQLACGGFF